MFASSSSHLKSVQSPSGLNPSPIPYFLDGLSSSMLLRKLSVSLSIGRQISKVFSALSSHWMTTTKTSEQEENRTKKIKMAKKTSSYSQRFSPAAEIRELSFIKKKRIVNSKVFGANSTTKSCFFIWQPAQPRIVFVGRKSGIGSIK